MKGFTLEHITINKSGEYSYPNNCLRATFRNDGGSKVFVNNVIPLEPGEEFPIPDIQGKYLIGKFYVRVTDISTPYTAETRINLVYLKDAN